MKKINKPKCRMCKFKRNSICQCGYTLNSEINCVGFEKNKIKKRD